MRILLKCLNCEEADVFAGKSGLMLNKFVLLQKLYAVKHLLCKLESIGKVVEMGCVGFCFAVLLFQCTHRYGTLFDIIVV